MLERLRLVVFLKSSVHSRAYLSSWLENHHAMSAQVIA